MITAEGPQLIEYNVRFGDPEAQVLMPRLTSDLGAALFAAADGVLKDFTLRWSDDVALTVVMAARGYPGAVEKGSEIRASPPPRIAGRARLPCGHEAGRRPPRRPRRARAHVTALGAPSRRRRRRPTRR